MFPPNWPVDEQMVLFFLIDDLGGRVQPVVIGATAGLVVPDSIREQVEQAMGGASK